MEDIVKLIDDYAFFKLDSRGNIEEAHNFEENVEGESFLNIISEEDKKKAAKLFIEVNRKGKSEGIIRLKQNDAYQIFSFKFIKIDDSIYGIAKEIMKEKPSFISDFLGNIIYTDEKWREIEERNIFEIIENREKFMDVIKTAIDEGEYEGRVIINEKEARIRIKATQWLEFFIEEDIYKLLEEIMDGRNVEEIFEKIKQVLNLSLIHI